MDQPVIAAHVRKHKGKGAVRKLRENNQMPAIFYGPKAEPIMLAVDCPELERIIRLGVHENMILDLQVETDQGAETRKVMLKDLTIDPVKDIYLHADFCEISMDKEISVSVPIHTINTPAGVKEGGFLQHIRRELTISCLPDKLIKFLELDVSGLEIGDSLHVRDIELPEGIRSADEDHLTIAVLAAPAVAEEEEEVEAEGAEAEGAEAEGAEAKVETSEES